MKYFRLALVSFASIFACIFSPTSIALSYTAVLLDDEGEAFVPNGGINSSGQVILNKPIYPGAHLPYYQPYIVSQTGSVIKKIDIITGDDATATGLGINDSGQVVGTSSAPGVTTGAFVTGRLGEGITLFGNPLTSANSINNLGQIAGTDVTQTTQYLPFITDTNTLTLHYIDLQGQNFGVATGINNSGQVTGTSQTTGYSGISGFITGTNGIGTHYVGEFSSDSNFGFIYPTGINDSGQVVGGSYLSDGSFPAFATGQNGIDIKYLDSLGGINAALDINNNGQIVGRSSINSYSTTAFIVNNTNSETIDLNTLTTLPNGRYITSAVAINDSGMIVAEASGEAIYLLLPTDNDSEIESPSAIEHGVFHFNVQHVEIKPVVYIDPVIATGYIYATNTSDPNFASVILPDIGDGDFILDYIFNGQNIMTSISHDTEYFFPQGGVNTFRVTGIETSANLDPADSNAFVTGLTFASQGNFTGTMTPITTFISLPATDVPEPDTLSATTVGLLAFMIIGQLNFRQRRYKQVESGCGAVATGSTCLLPPLSSGDA